MLLLSLITAIYSFLAAFEHRTNFPAKVAGTGSFVFRRFSLPIVPSFLSSDHLKMYKHLLTHHLQRQRLRPQVLQVCFSEPACRLPLVNGKVLLSQRSTTFSTHRRHHTLFFWHHGRPTRVQERRSIAVVYVGRRTRLIWRWCPSQMVGLRYLGLGQTKPIFTFYSVLRAFSLRW